MKPLNLSNGESDAGGFCVVFNLIIRGDPLNRVKGVKAS
jgi:hypothetical protein